MQFSLIEIQGRYGKLCCLHPHCRRVSQARNQKETTAKQGKQRAENRSLIYATAVP
jgi:hypothetical protein